VAFSYSGDPGASRRDAVRFWMGDTNSANALLQDGEVDYLVEQNPGSVLLAAAQGLEIAAAARLAGSSGSGTGTIQSKTVGDLSITYGSRTTEMSQQAQVLTERAQMLRARAAMQGTPIFTGGSESEKLAQEDNTDRVVPAFSVRMLEDWRTW
jgi:hypothetical protein